jgi:glycosyltransferase involved in cell wall biosynthesis
VTGIANPKVTVLMSAFNNADYIESAIESIINQTLQDIELLIIDDGSTDNTLELARRYRDSRVEVFSQANTGKAAAVNVLIEQAKGEYITFQDADDMSSPNRLEVLAGYLDRESDLAMIFSGYSLIIEDKVCAPRRVESKRLQCKHDIDNYTMPCLDPTMMVKTSLAKQYKFNPELRICEGLDFILRIGEEHPMVVIPDILYQYRFHYSSITKTQLQKRSEYLLKVTNYARKRRHAPILTKEEFHYRIGQYLKDDNNLSGHFTDSAYLSVKSNRRGEALKTAMTSLRYVGNGGIHFVKPLIYASMPKIINDMIRGS